GVATGLMLSYWFLYAVSSYRLPSDIPITIDARLDMRVVLFGGAAGLFATICFGALPAFVASRRISTPQAAENRVTPGLEKGARITRLFVAGQTAAAVVLVVCAALFAGGFWKATQMEPGFEVRGGMYFTTDTQLLGLSDTDGFHLYRNIEDRLRAV